jgi:hypothetical protein
MKRRAATSFRNACPAAIAASLHSWEMLMNRIGTHFSGPVPGRLLMLFALLFALGRPALADAPYRQLAVLQPKDGATVFSNPGHVDVRLGLAPASELAAGDRVELLLDGHRVAEAQGMQIALDHVDRGTHRLQARIIDGDGKTLIESVPITFQMWQASRNFPSRHH